MFGHSESIVHVGQGYTVRAVPRSQVMGIMIF
jgi:hypothetical protein